MKKLIAILLAALMLVTMVACDDGNKPASDETTAEKTGDTTTVADDNETTTAAQTTEAPNGSGSVPATLKKEDLYGTWSLRMDLSAVMAQSLGDNMEALTAVFGEGFMDSLSSEMDAILVFDEEGAASGLTKADMEAFFTNIINGMAESLKNGGALTLLAQSMGMTEAEAQAYLDENGVSIDTFVETIMQQMPAVDELIESSGIVEKDGYCLGGKTPYEVTDDAITCDNFKMTYAVEDGKIIIKSYGEGEMMAEVNCELVRVK